MVPCLHEEQRAVIGGCAPKALFKKYGSLIRCVSLKSFFRKCHCHIKICEILKNSNFSAEESVHPGKCHSSHEPDGTPKPPS